MNSIEWLEKELRKNENIRWRGANIEDMFEQAQEMHKQEIINAYDKGEFDCGCNGTSEEYYNETYKKNRL